MKKRSDGYQASSYTADQLYWCNLLWFTVGEPVGWRLVQFQSTPLPQAVGGPREGRQT